MMEISDSKKDRISELISDKDVKIIGDVVIAFLHKKPVKSFFRDHMEVDEKKWDEMVEDEAYEWTY